MITFTETTWKPSGKFLVNPEIGKSFHINSIDSLLRTHDAWKCLNFTSVIKKMWHTTAELEIVTSWNVNDLERHPFCRYTIIVLTSGLCWNIINLNLDLHSIKSFWTIIANWRFIYVLLVKYINGFTSIIISSNIALSSNKLEYKYMSISIMTLTLIRIYHAHISQPNVSDWSCSQVWRFES